MKRILTLIWLGILCLPGCRKQPGPELRFLKDSITVGSDAGSATIAFVSTQPWRIDADATWCQVIPGSGNGAEGKEQPVTVIFEENRTPDERVCTVTLQAGGLTASTDIIQGHVSGVLLTQQEASIGPEEQTIRIPLRKAADYTAEADESCKDWLSVISTKSMSVGEITVLAKENRSIARTGLIRIRSNGQEATLSVRQSCGYVIFDDPAFAQSCRDFDMDGDGRISVDEAHRITGTIYIPADVKSVTGLEHFTQIEGLHSRAPLTSLDLHPLQRLRSLTLLQSALEELDLNGLPSLSTVEISQDLSLREIHTGTCYALSYLTIYGCPQLKSFHIQGLQRLSRVNIDSNGLVSLHAEDLPALREFISHNPALTDLRISRCPGLERLALSADALTSLDLTGLGNLKDLSCSLPLQELDLSPCPKLQSLELGTMTLQTIDLSACPDLGFLSCMSVSIDRLDVTPCKKIYALRASRSTIRSLQVKDCPSLTELSFGGNQLEDVTIQDCSSLESLYLSQNKLTGLQLKGLPSLRNLGCGGNPLVSLDVSECPALYDLYVAYTSLESLDLTHNPALYIVTAMPNDKLKTIYLILGHDYLRVTHDIHTRLIYQ